MLWRRPFVTAVLAVAPAMTGCVPGSRPLASNAAKPVPATEPHTVPRARPTPAAEATAASDSGGEALETASEDESEPPEDSLDVAPPPDATVHPNPLDGVSDAELDRRLLSNPKSLGSMSIGKTNAGLLFNGVRMPPGDAWDVVSPDEAWATEETVHYLETAIHAVTAEFPDSPKLEIGAISSKNGGHLSPHVSHQAGRDVDISYYYLGGGHWYERANAENLDVARTWAFVRALVTQTDVELLLIDRSLQTLLRAEAERIGEDPGWLDTLFRGRGNLPPLIRHAPGHATHMHIRFYNPIAQETGRRVYAALLRRGLIRVGAAYATHIARKGETLAQLARRYHTTVRVLRRANGLHSTVIQAKKSYRIPLSGHAVPSLANAPVAIPPRRLPPARPSSSSPRSAGGSPGEDSRVHGRSTAG